jgi:outer membrane protein assembly factor BamB
MKKILPLLLTLLLTVSTVQAKPNPDWWAQFGHDPEKTGTSNDEYLPLYPPLEEAPKSEWDVQYNINAPLSTPIIFEGNLYLVQKDYYDDKSKYYEGSIKVLSIENGKKFSETVFRVPDTNDITPVPSPAVTMVGNERLIVMGDQEGKLNRIKGLFPIQKIGPADPVPYPMVSSPTIKDNLCYIGSDSSNVFCFDIDTMTFVRRFKADGGVSTSPTIFGDYVFFGDNSGTFFIYDRNTGKNITKIRPAQNEKDLRINSTATIAESGGLHWAVFGASGGYVFKVGLEGNQFGKSYQFRTAVNRLGKRPTFWATPTIYDNQIYIGADDGSFYRISLDSMKSGGSIQFENSIFSQAVRSGKYIYLTTYSTGEKRTDGKLNIIDLETFSYERAALKQIVIAGGSITSPVIAGGCLYIASGSGKVYKFHGQKPEIEVTFEPKNLDFSTVKVGENAYGKIKIKSKKSQTPPLVGEIITSETSKDWMTLGAYTFKTDSEIEIDVTIRTEFFKDKISHPTEFTTEITIDSNAGKSTTNPKVVFSPELPSIQASKSQFDFTAYEGKPELIPGKFTISLLKGFSATVDISSDKGWLKIQNSLETLSTAVPRIDIQFECDTSSLPLGKSHATITIGNMSKVLKPISLKVTIEVKERPPDPWIEEPSKILVIDDCFSGSTYNGEFTFINRGGGKLSNPQVISKDAAWLVKTVFAESSNSSLVLLCTIDPSTLWPNDPEPTCKITVKINEKIFNCTLKLELKQLDVCKIEFVIGKKEYKVNERKLPMDAVAYISKTGNTMVPIRYIGDPLSKFFGAKIEWIGELKTVLFIHNDITLRLIIGYDNAIIELPDGNIETKRLSSPPEVVGGRTFVPPRIIAETFGAQVNWDSQTKTATFIFKQAQTR